ncbi:hypothetical protein pb186bvf_015455 [Paramecium bursaria]
MKNTHIYSFKINYLYFIYYENIYNQNQVPYKYILSYRLTIALQLMVTMKKEIFNVLHAEC